MLGDALDPKAWGRSRCWRKRQGTKTLRLGADPLALDMRQPLRALYPDPTQQALQPSEPIIFTLSPPARRSIIAKRGLGMDGTAI